ncbi:unnamed protein product, partial [Brenthis ino]
MSNFLMLKITISMQETHSSGRLSLSKPWRRGAGAVAANTFNEFAMRDIPHYHKQYKAEGTPSIALRHINYSK